MNNQKKAYSFANRCTCDKVILHKKSMYKNG